MRKFFLGVFLCIGTILFSQNGKYPSNYFRSPLDIPLVLSGTFGELRSNHFHSGIDVKTQGKVGLKIYAAASGYVSRIKVSHWGYGKALYVKHPNGYTTVYAHLKKFSPKIEKYLKRQQYQKESFQIQLFPGANTLTVKKGEVIADSGNSGGSFAPHLHFEVRDSRTEKIINPLFFGFKVEDAKRPQVTSLMVYPLSENSQVNQSNKPLKIAIKQLADGNFISDRITAFGKIGLGVAVFDRLGIARNKNGIYKLSQKVNGHITHEFTANTFAFNETKYINLLIDYERYKKVKQRVHKSYIHPLSKLSMYNDKYADGSVLIEQDENYQVEIIVSDVKGNQRKVTIPIRGKKEDILVKDKPKVTPYYVDYKKFKKIQQGNITVAFPKYTFYKNTYLDVKISDGVAKIHEETMPLHKKYTLTFNTAGMLNKKYMYIAKVDKKGRKSYVSTTKKQNKCYTTTKYLGSYTLAYDSIPPKVRLYKSKDKQWMTKYKTLKVKISDVGTGIKNYRAEIDGKWILMEYEPKKGLLIYNFNDKKYTTSKHTLKVRVTDNVGNVKRFTSTFYRKK